MYVIDGIAYAGEPHMPIKISGVKPLDNYRLWLRFSTGETKIFDVTPYIEGEWFGKLRDPEMFGSVRPCGSTVEWAGGQDIAPHELYELSAPWDPDFTKLTPAERRRGGQNENRKI